ncbi:MAG TPA: methylated-DNA--[protein]-cysteine S-methyltransferase [Acidimicrobiales bacterium]|jgi:O-6-methylguanine DNA methyltransferase|nr:methylated-DNA--[protein]-cysteine S-methyltransferase [Acidimicrobiales bacterium]
MSEHASYASVATPLGPAFVAWTDRGVCAVDVSDDEAGFAAFWAARLGRPLERASAVPDAVAAAVATGEVEGVALDLRGISPFAAAVLRAVASIPRGEVQSYGWVARQAGRPRAVRAAASAIARNPVPLVVPCHRVVRGDGRIGNYGLGGSAAKRKLLAGEGFVASD